MGVNCAAESTGSPATPLASAPGSPATSVTEHRARVDAAWADVEQQATLAARRLQGEQNALANPSLIAQLGRL